MTWRHSLLARLGCARRLYDWQKRMLFRATCTVVHTKGYYCYVRDHFVVVPIGTGSFVLQYFAEILKQTAFFNEGVSSNSVCLGHGAQLGNPEGGGGSQVF